MASDRLVYLNGEFVPETEAKISIFDSALMFGDMVFEMTRSFNGKQFKLKEHLERLYASMKYLHIPEPMTMKAMEEVCYLTMEENAPAFLPTDEHRLMINVSRGPLSLYSEVFGNKLRPTVVVADFPLKWTVSGMGHLFDKGINAVVPSQRAIPASLLEPKVKNRSRVHYMMANIEVSQTAGEDNWALLLDPDGFVAEGSGDNFFIVKNGVVISPEGRNILRGISRDYIFEISKQMDLPCIEKNFELYDVVTADEAFMTATPFCLLPVTRINGTPINGGSVGPVFKKLLGRWSANVGLDIEAQIKAFSAEVKEAKAAGASPYQFRSPK